MNSLSNLRRKTAELRQRSDLDGVALDIAIGAHIDAFLFGLGHDAFESLFGVVHSALDLAIALMEKPFSGLDLSNEMWDLISSGTIFAVEGDTRSAHAMELIQSLSPDEFSRIVYILNFHIGIIQSSGETRRTIEPIWERIVEAAAGQP